MKSYYFSLVILVAVLENGLGENSLKDLEIGIYSLAQIGAELLAWTPVRIQINT